MMAAVSSDEAAVLRDNMRKLETVKHAGLMQIAARTTKACETVLSLTEDDIAADEDFITLRKGVLDMPSWIAVIDETLDSLPKQFREKVKEKVRDKGKLSKTLKNIATLGKSASPGWSGFQQRPNLAEMNFWITKRIEQFKVWLHNSKHGAEFPLHITNETAGSLTRPEPPQNEDPAARIYGGGLDTSSRSNGMEDATTIKCRIEPRNQTPPAISSDQMGPDEPGEIISSEEPRATTVREPDVPQADQVPGPSRAENGGSDNFDQEPQPLNEPETGQLAPEERSESRTGIPEEGEHQPNGSHSHIVPTADPRDPPEDELVSVNDIEPGEEGDVMPSGYFAPPEPYDGERQLQLDVRDNGVWNDAESDSGDLDTIDSNVREDNTTMQYDFLIYHEEKDTSAAKAVKDDMTAYFCNRNIPPRIALIDDFHYEGLFSNQLQAAVQQCTLAMFYISENTKDRRESMVKELNTLMMMSENFNGCIEGILIIGHGNLDQMSNCLENDNIYVRMKAQITRGYFNINADDFLKKMYEWYTKYNRSTTEREQLHASPNAGVNAPVNPNVYQPLDC